MKIKSPGITRAKNTLSGKARIKKSRITVSLVLGEILRGDKWEDIGNNYNITIDEIKNCLAYARACVDYIDKGEIEEELKAPNVGDQVRFKRRMYIAGGVVPVNVWGTVNRVLVEAGNSQYTIWVKTEKIPGLDRIIPFNPMFGPRTADDHDEPFKNTVEEFWWYCELMKSA